MSDQDDKKKDPNDPSSTSEAYDRMLPRWQKIDALLGGTEAMREAGAVYLPPHPEETATAWQARLQNATLLNMTEMTLDSWVGRPFSDPVRFKDVPEQIQNLFSDIDLQGTAFEVFLRNWFRDGVAKAFSHVLVEFPRKTLVEGRVRTRADDINDNLRPYLVHILPENIIFAATETINGRETLTHLRIVVKSKELNGFIETEKLQIKVFTPGHVDVYERREESARKKSSKKVVKWVKVDEYDYDLSYIPLVTFYANREGLMCGKPPLTDLADLNVAHWQSMSDQRVILTTSRFPVMALSGGSSDDNKLTVGPNKWLYCPDAQGRFYYVEHTGKAIGAGRQDLLDLEEQMSNYGADFLKKRPGSVTATARALDSAEATSPLQDMTIRFMAAVNEAMRMMADWLSIKEIQGTVVIPLDFGPDEVTNVDLNALNEARKRRDLSREAYLDELKRRGVLADDFDQEADKALLEQEQEDMIALAGTMADLDPAADPTNPDPTADPKVPSPDPAPTAKTPGVKNGG